MVRETERQSAARKNAMLWVRQTKVVRHLEETPRGLLEIPVRISFEYAVEEDRFVARSMTRSVLYNRRVALRHVRRDIETAVAETVDSALVEHLRFAGHLPEPVPLYPEPAAEEDEAVDEVPQILLTPRG